MGKIRFYHLKYRKKKIIIGYCDFKDFEWYVTKVNGNNIIFINDKRNFKLKSDLLHKIIKRIK